MTVMKQCTVAFSSVLIWAALLALPASAQSLDPALPPQASTDCTGDVSVSVASDARAQSDIYAAALLAAAIGTYCIVLTGPRDAPCRTRLSLRQHTLKS